MTLTVEAIAEAREKVRAMMDESTAAYNDHIAELRAKLVKLDDWLWKNAEHTADSVTEEYIALRDERSAIKETYETADDELKRQMTLRETWLLQQLDGIGAESLRTPHGTAYVQVKTRANCADWPLFWSYIKQNDRFDLLEKRVSQAPISKMIKDGEDLPPAINTFSERVVTVRRS